MLPADQAHADAIGYDPTKIFYGNAGDDILAGCKGHDQMFGADGNNIMVDDDHHLLAVGEHVPDPLGGFCDIYHDEIHAGSGNDIVFATRQDTSVDHIPAVLRGIFPYNKIARGSSQAVGSTNGSEWKVSIPASSSIR